MKRAFSALLLFVAAAAHAQIPALDTTVERVRKDFGVPGIAVAVVKDGKVVVAKGYGVRELGKPEAVDANTMFQIASLTKAFTAAALAILVDEEKVRWDDAVIQYLPDFAMYDPYVTRELTVRDLLVHRSGLGLGAGDLLWYPRTTYSRADIMKRLRHIQPATSFRSRYAYDNVLYLVAGEVIRAVSGKSWDDFVTERILTPAGMTSTVTTFGGLMANPNRETPHVPVDGKITPFRYDDVDNTGPAASMSSTANDYAKWMILQLNRGKLGEKAIFSEKQSREMWSSQTIQPIAEPKGALAFNSPNFAAYGLGWGTRDYRGRKILTHSGALTGTYSRVTLLPDLNLGVAVFTNQQASGSMEPIIYTVLDHYLGNAKTDWVAKYTEYRAEQTTKYEDEAKKLAETRAKESKPSLPLASYAGRYTDPWYGDVVVEHENGKLVMKFAHTPELVGDLEHWHYDTFVARWRSRGLDADAFVTFQLDANGKVEQVKMKPVSSRTDFSFDFQDLLLSPAP